MPEVNGWKFKEEAPVTYTSEPWYDLAEGGYISPHDMLDNKEQADEVMAAVHLIMSFLSTAEEVGFVEYT